MSNEMRVVEDKEEAGLIGLLSGLQRRLQFTNEAAYLDVISGIANVSLEIPPKSDAVSRKNTLRHHAALFKIALGDIDAGDYRKDIISEAQANT